MSTQALNLIFITICFVSIVVIGASLIALFVRYNKIKESNRNSDFRLQKILSEEIEDKKLKKIDFE